MSLSTAGESALLPGSMTIRLAGILLVTPDGPISRFQ